MQICAHRTQPVWIKLSYRKTRLFYCISISNNATIIYHNILHIFTYFQGEIIYITYS